MLKNEKKGSSAFLPQIAVCVTEVHGALSLTSNCLIRGRIWGCALTTEIWYQGSDRIKAGLTRSSAGGHPRCQIPGVTQAGAAGSEVTQREGQVITVVSSKYARVMFSMPRYQTVSEMIYNRYHRYGTD